MRTGAWCASARRPACTSRTTWRWWPRWPTASWCCALARVVAGLVAPAEGQILFDGKPLPRLVEGRTREELRRVQIVFQMADTALNPQQTIAQILARPLQLYLGLKGDALDKRIAKLLE